MPVVHVKVEIDLCLRKSELGWPWKLLCSFITSANAGETVIAFGEGGTAHDVAAAVVAVVAAAVAFSVLSGDGCLILMQKMM